MKPNSNEGSLLRNLSLAGLLCCALLGLAWWKSVITTENRSCRVCAAASDRKTLSLYGHALTTWDTEPAPTDLTRNYFDRYLGHPHAHQWGSQSGRYVVLLSTPISSHHGGAPTPPGPSMSAGSAPFYRMDLTDKGLQLVAASGIREAEGRRRYFDYIILQPGTLQDPDVNHYLRVIQTWGEIYRQIPKGPSGKPAAGFIWSPEMEGITIPAEVKAGKLMPLAIFPPQVKGP